MGGSMDRRESPDRQTDPFIRTETSVSRFTRQTTDATSPLIPKESTPALKKSKPGQRSQSVPSKREELKVDVTPPSSSPPRLSPTQHSHSIRLRSNEQLSESFRLQPTQAPSSNRLSPKPVEHQWNQLVVSCDRSRRAIAKVSEKRKRHEADQRERSLRERRAQKEDARRQRQFFDEFKRFLENNKNKNVMLYCTCPDKKYNSFRRLKLKTKNFFQKAGRVIWIFCCPPCPSKQVDKAAFWAPQPYYIFFRDPRPPELVDPQKAEIIVKKANRSCLGNIYRIAPDHPCSKEKPDVEGFVIETAHGNFIACAITRTRHPRKPPLTIIYAHTNGEDLYDVLYSTPDIVDMALFFECDVVAFDYSGYGMSSGSPDEDHFYADIEAVWLHVTEKLRVPPDQLIFFGYSIGTAAMVHLGAKCSEAAKNRPAGVILLAPMCTVFSVKCGCCAPRCERCMCADRYNNYAKIASIQAPVLIVHGTKDRIVGIDHGKRLHKKLVEKHGQNVIEPLWIVNGTHDHLDSHWELWQRLDYFIKKEIRVPRYSRSKSASTTKTGTTEK